MGTNQIISISVLCLLSGIATFAYLMRNSALYPKKMTELEEDERLNRYFIITMITSLIIVLIIAGAIVYAYLKIIF